MTVGTNIRKLRKAKGMTLLELANQVDSDVGNLSRLERGVQGYSEAMLERIAAALNIAITDFFTSESNVEELAMRGRIPLISWVAAGNWCQVSDPYPIDGAEDWLACPVKHGSHTYALRVRGDSMYNPGTRPSFEDGDIIFVDPDRTAVHRSLVIVRLDDENEATFKRLLVDGEKKMLEALNAAWPDRIFPVKSNATICGVVIARIESFT